MSNIINISDKITNQLPVVQISEEIVVTVNNRRSTVLNVQAMVKENERNAKEGKGLDDNEFMDKALYMFLGEKNGKAIIDLDLPLPEYKIVFNTIMGAATGTLEETPK